MEVRFAKKMMQKYPFWTVLSLRRLIYSFEKRQVVISKVQAAEWALRNLLTQWRTLIRTALRVYLRKHGDQGMLKKSSNAFSKFASDRIAQARHTVRKKPPVH
jgi:hypothetical protein